MLKVGDRLPEFSVLNLKSEEDIPKALVISLNVHPAWHLKRMMSFFSLRDSEGILS